MAMSNISLKQARRIALFSQGLLHKEAFGRGLKAVQKVIDQLHYVQIDTISVVDRAHHHVLNTRVPNYSPNMLHELQSVQKTAFEYWFHAAAYLPMDDYRYYLPIMHGIKKKRSVNKKSCNAIVNRITAEGPLQSRDFASAKGKKSNGWWDWKPEKRVLESMFLSGDLMICERKGFQKVYDLTENVLPEHIDTRYPSDSERGYFYVRRMLTNLGVARLKDICVARAMTKHSDYDLQAWVNKSLQEMLEASEVLSFTLNGSTYYCLTETVNTTPKRVGHKKITFLSPFDNLVINRNRLLELFDFDYQLECYVPKEKRKFGYFTLPILYGDELVGRIDCKADRKTGVFLVNNLWLEDGMVVDDKFSKALSQSLIDYKTDLQCDTITIENMENKKLKKSLMQRI